MPVRGALQGIRPNELTDRDSFFRFGREPEGFEILAEIPGVDFDQAWARRVEIVIDATTGLKANFISAGDLIVSKLASGRPQDVADAYAIQQQTIRAGSVQAGDVPAFNLRMKENAVER